MTSVQVHTYGDTIVSRKLHAMADQAESFENAWDDVVEIVARGYERSFQLEGPGWPELKLKTILNRIAAGHPPGPIRTASGKDRAAMTDPNQLDYIGGAHDLNIIGTDVSELHQYGFSTAMGRGHVPARPLKLTRWYKDEISRCIKRHLSLAYDLG
jgi:phage gpG-like protein